MNLEEMLKMSPEQLQQLSTQVMEQKIVDTSLAIQVIIHDLGIDVNEFALELEKKNILPGSLKNYPDRLDTIKRVVHSEDLTNLEIFYHGMLAGIGLAISELEEFFEGREKDAEI